jgi:hypothetical protein
MSSPLIFTLTALLTIVVLGSSVVEAQSLNHAKCEQLYKPNVGQTGKDVVWVPTPDGVVHQMLTMAKTTSRDYVIDLGAGDGKIAIAAGRDFGARALGIEYNPDMVKLANCMVQAEGVAGKVKVIQGDIFKQDFSKADVVTLYLLPELNLCIRHRLLAMKPGTRVASHQFHMDDWDPDEKGDIGTETVYFWLVPARVGGAWDFSDTDGKYRFGVNLNQTFQKIEGETILAGNKQPLQDATLKADEIRFTFNDDGVTRTLIGSVRGNRIISVLKAADGSEMQVTGITKAAPTAGEWVKMASHCAKYYKR